MIERNLLSVLRCGLLMLVAMVAIHAGTDAVERGSPTDPYGPWSQGRPGESLDLLLGRAKATDRWDAWYDAGLAAAAAGDKGQAVSYLVTAHRRNPAASEPRDALRALDVPLPATWVERAGPLALPGRGWTGVALLAIAGLAFGYGLVRWQNGRWKRRGLAVAGLVSALIAAPGIAAVMSDADVPWATVIHDTQALDSTGTPIKALPAGTLVIKEQDEPWAGRTVVRLVDNGQIVLVASADAR
jgi:hypothetical protein